MARGRCAAPRSARCSASCPAAARCSRRSPPTRSRRRSRRTRAQFGKGAIQGVAGPESANNAGAQTSFIPLLTLGIPANAVMALMVGAMTIHNIQPGPQVMTSNPALFWGLIASMWVGNLMLVVLNLPLIGIWIKLLHGALPPALSGDPAVLRDRRLHDQQHAASTSGRPRSSASSASSSSSSNASRRRCCSGFVLGPMMEENLRRALLLSRGDPTVFVTRPISLAMLAIAGAAAAADRRAGDPQEARRSVPPKE